MRFIKKWSYSCSNYMAKTLGESHQKRQAYYFGYQIIIGSIVKYIVSFSIALLLGIFIPVLVIMAVFTTLRLVAGGYHMDTYGKCLFVSLVLFVLAGLVSQYLYLDEIFVFALIALTSISGLYVLKRYAPKDTPNKPIKDPEEIKKFKTLSIIYLFVLIVLTLVLAFFNFSKVSVSICMGVLLELFAISKIGHAFFDNIRDGIAKRCLHW